MSLGGGTNNDSVPQLGLFANMRLPFHAISETRVVLQEMLAEKNMANASLFTYRIEKRQGSSFLNTDIASLGLFILEVFPLVMPEGLSVLYPSIYVFVYKYVRVVSYVIILMHFFSTLKTSKKVPTTLVAGVLFNLVGIAVVFAHSMNITGWLSVFGPCFFGVILVWIYRSHLDRLVVGLLVINEFWIYVNFAAMLAFPDGMYVSANTGNVDNWILGYKSSLQYFVLPALCFSLINMEYRKQRIRTVVLIVVSFFETVHSENAMLLVSLIILVLLYLFQRRWGGFAFNARNYLIVVVATNVVLVFFTSWFVNTDFGMTLLDLLGKNSTLSTRATVIWPETLSAISDSPWLGYGILDSDSRVFMYHDIAAAIHAHNQALEFAFIGGYILLGTFIGLLIAITHNLMVCSSTRSSKIFSVCIFSFLIAITVEVFTRNLGTSLWVMLFLGGMCKQVDSQFSCGEGGVWQVKMQPNPIDS